MWTYGLGLWGSAKPLNLKRIQTLQSRILGKITNAPFYVSNYTLHKELNIHFVHDLAIESYDKSPNPLVQEFVALTSHTTLLDVLKDSGLETYFSNKNEDAGLNSLHLICNYHQNHWFSYLYSCD
jgi:hypothetical protein